jgi:hypothetical protein
MPHKRVGPVKQKPPADQVATLGELAQLLGRTDDTITQWNQRGLVVGKRGAYSVALTYLRARHAGLEPAMPRDPALQSIILAADPTAGGDGDDALTDEEGRPILLPGNCPYDPIVRKKAISYAGAYERERVIGQGIVNERQRIEVDKTRGELLTAEEAANAAAEVRDRFMRSSVALPSRVEARLREGKVELSHSQRAALVAAIEAVWAEILDEVGR